MKRSGINLNKKVIALLCAFTLVLAALNDFIIVKAIDPPVGSIPAKISGTEVRMRQEANTSSTILKYFDDGEVIYILDKSDSSWYKVEDTGGKIGYCYSTYIKETGDPIQPPTPSDPSNPTPTPTGITIHKNKTLYTRVDNAVTWESSNGAVATVDNGYILGVSPGSVVISAKDSTGKVLSCKQYAVGEAEGVRTAYCSPNIAGFGDTVTLYAITDNTKNAVRFVTNGQTIDTTTYTQDGSTRVFSATTTYGNTGKGDTLGSYCVNTAEGYISKIAAETTVSAFLSGIPNSGNYKVYNGNTEVSGDTKIATGMTVKSGGGDTWSSLTVIVTGDTNGDGTITISDLVTVRNKILGIRDLSGAFSIAANTNGDTTISISDLVQIRSHLLNINHILPLAYGSTNSTSTPQTFEVKAYSSTDGGANWSGDYKSSSAYIIGSSNPNTTTTEIRRATDKVITDMIAPMEGFSSNVYPDQLAGGTPTLGYGYTFGVGSEFYNGITLREGYALLVNTVNGSYTSDINNFLRNHSLKANQHQFDALVSMDYNLGPGFLDSKNDPQSWLVNAPGGDLNNMSQVYNGTADPNHKIIQNVGKIGFANEMLLWTKSVDSNQNTIHLGGLLRRRMVESLLFNEGIYQDMTFRDVFAIAPQYGYTVPIYDSSSSTYGYK